MRHSTQLDGISQVSAEIEPSPASPLLGFWKILELMRRGGVNSPERPFVAETLARCEKADSLERKALEYAAREFAAARGQRNGTVALLRGMRVAGILAKEFHARDPEMIAAALLHDVLEEDAGDVEEIEREFGETVTDYIVLLTPPRFFRKAERMRVYAEGLASAPEEVLLIKLAELRDDLEFRRSSEAKRAYAIAPRILDSVLRQRELQASTRDAVEQVQQQLRVRLSTSPARRPVDGFS